MASSSIAKLLVSIGALACCVALPRTDGGRALVPRALGARDLPEPTLPRPPRNAGSAMGARPTTSEPTTTLAQDPLPAETTGRQPGVHRRKLNTQAGHDVMQAVAWLQRATGIMLKGEDADIDRTTTHAAVLSPHRYHYLVCLFFAACARWPST